LDKNQPDGWQPIGAKNFSHLSAPSCYGRRRDGGGVRRRRDGGDVVVSGATVMVVMVMGPAPLSAAGRVPVCGWRNGP